MKEPGDMTDDELNIAITEKVMGVPVVAERWPCMVGDERLLPYYDLDPMPGDKFLVYAPIAYVASEISPILWVVPAYTTDARETEKVMERVKALGGCVEPWCGSNGEGATCWTGNSWARADAADWKRAVCEAALLAVRGAAE